MPLIANNYITQRLIPAVDLERLIGQFVKLKRSGANVMGCCPFHQEKTPSFCVTPAKQMFYCFGCHASGNAIDFLMKFKNLDFVEAVEELSAFAGLTVEYEESGRARRDQGADKLKLYYDLMERCATLFSRCLFEPRGKVGYDYYLQNRGLTRESLLHNRLGFAPDSWHLLEEEVCTSKEEQQLLTDLGMLVEKDDHSTFSMFRNRIMIPVLDKRGRVISFGGRTMGDDKPKYMNTKESPIFKKRNELFGLYEALRDNRNRPQRLVIVEGYMDVIAVRQYGCTYAVASLGTATTLEQFRIMFRYTKEIICCYDGDEAGRNAAWHALKTVTPALDDEHEIRFAFLPPEDDPDSLVRKSGLQAFLEYLDKSRAYPDFLISHITSKYNLADPNKISKCIAEALGEIAQIPTPTLRLVSIRMLSTVTRFAESELMGMLSGYREQAASSHLGGAYLGLNEHQVSLENDRLTQTRQILTTPMRRLIAFILQQPVVIGMVYDVYALDSLVELCEKLKLQGSGELKYLLQTIGAKRDITSATLLEMTRGTQREAGFRQLMQADLGLRELSLAKRAARFYELIAMVLAEPMKNRAARLVTRGNRISDAEMDELTMIKGELRKIGVR